MHAHRIARGAWFAAMACCALLATAGRLLSAEAERKTPYVPVGAPVDPKVPAQWNRYHDYRAATELLQRLRDAHPDRCRLLSLGRSYGDHEMWVFSITNFSKGKELAKPACWIDGGIHANEIQATEVTLYTAWYLLESYGQNPLVKRLLDERVFYIMPMMSPDSRDAHMYRPNSPHSPRGGQRPVDDDRDGLVDEDKPDDLDGDLSITQMRVADPNGRWKPHSDFPNLLIEAKDDEPGLFTLLGSEGFDNDGDGRVNEDGDGYYDPNRNWPWNWPPEMVQDGAANYPFSVPEVRMAADFIMAHPNIAAGQSYHNAGGMILRGPGVKTDTYERSDVAVLTSIASKGEMILPGYRSMETGKELYETYGVEFDWLYQMQGVFAYTNELFTPANYFHEKPSGGFFDKAEDQHRFNKYVLLGEGSIPWKKVKHPQYGEVEVGGFKKSWLRQPPSFMLEEECHRNMAFTLYHADQMPQLDIQKVEVEKLPGNLTRVSAVVANRKLMPTRAAVDVKRKLFRPDLAILSGKNIQVLAGMTSKSMFFELPSEQKHHPEELRLGAIPGMRATYVRWIVAGQGPFTLRVDCVKAGVAERTGTIEAHAGSGSAGR